MLPAVETTVAATRSTEGLRVLNRADSSISVALSQLPILHRLQTAADITYDELVSELSYSEIVDMNSRLCRHQLF